jgi:hypothetical protein
MVTGEYRRGDWPGGNAHGQGKSHKEQSQPGFELLTKRKKVDEELLTKGLYFSDKTR